MPERSVSFRLPTNELRKGDQVVGLTDKIYPVKGRSFLFDEVLVKGDLTGPLDYNGHRIEILKVETAIGLEITNSGPRGPVWKNVSGRVAT